MLRRVCMNGLLMMAFFVGFSGLHSVADAASKQDGFRLPSIKVPSFQVNPPRRFRTTILDMSTIIGKKPVILLYFAAGDNKSETELKAINALSRVYTSFAFYGVTRARSNRIAKLAYKRLEKLGVTLPILMDEKGLLKYYTMARQTPAYTVVDGKGIVKLIGASALTEKVSESATLMSFMQAVAANKPVKFVRAMGYSPNCFNLVGKKAPEFTASNALTPGKETLSTTVKKDKRPTVLVFWSITCPHCQAVLPVLNNFYKANKARFKLLTLANVDAAAMKQKLRAFASKHSFGLTVLNDAKGSTSDKYKVMMVPTFYLVDSKGVVRSAWMGGHKTLAKDMNSKLALLKK